MPDRAPTLSRFAEPLLLFVVGLFLLWAGGSDSTVLLPVSRGLGDEVGAIPAVSYEYGLILLLLSAVSYWLARLGRPLLALIFIQVTDAVSSPGRRGSPPSRFAFSVVLASIATGLVLRLRFVFRPVVYDEAFNYLLFIHGRVSRLFYYPLPNNHILNSLLVRLSTSLLGDSPFALRLPALAAGLLLIPLLYRVCRKLVPESGSGLLAAPGAALFPCLVLYSTACRGYALVCLLFVAMLDAALDAEGRLRRERVAVVGLLAALGMLTMPSMLYAIAGVGLWLTALARSQASDRARSLDDIALPFAGSVLLLTALLYLPPAIVNGGLSNVMSNRFFNPLSVSDFIYAVPGHLASTARWMLTGIGIAGGIGLAALAIIGTIESRQQRRMASALLLPAILSGSLIVLLLKRSIPFERTWIFLIPALLIAADAGFTVLLRRIGHSTRWSALPAVLAVPGAIWLADSRVLQTLPDMGNVPEAPAIAESIAHRVAADDIVCASLPVDASVHYYLSRTLEKSAGLPPSAPLRVFVVQDRTADFTPGSGTVQKIQDFGQHSLLTWTVSGPTLDRFADCWLPGVEQRKAARR